MRDPYTNVSKAVVAYYGSYASDTSSQPYSAVRAYYAGGPWYNYSGWGDYAARNAISCTPGSMVRLDDGLMHVCQ